MVMEMVMKWQWKFITTWDGDGSWLRRVMVMEIVRPAQGDGDGDGVSEIHHIYYSICRFVV